MRLFCLIFIIVEVLGSTIFSQAQSVTATQTVIVAHRGASGLAPENTLAAFDKAMEYADVLELDVHVSKDDSLIVMHDKDVDRTTNGKGEIRNLNYAYLKTLDAGSWFADVFKNERVLTLREVLRHVNGRKKVLIELKWPKGGIYENLVKAVIQSIRDCKAESWVILQSFEKKYLIQVHELAPDIVCHQLVYIQSNSFPIYHDRSFGLGEFEPLMFVKSVNISHKYVNKTFVERMHEKGCTVFVYTVNELDKMKKMQTMGVDGIITNRPDIAIGTR